MTALQRRVQYAVRTFYRKRHPKTKITSIRHIYPRCYVVARPAPSCLVVVRPWADAEPHMRAWDRDHGAGTFHGEPAFDHALKAGDWCSVAYVATASGGWSVAVPVVL